MVDFATAYEALKGLASEKTKRFRASGPETMVSATPEARFERPSHYHYPISADAFKALKDDARRKKGESHPRRVA
jgi:hypothetical protein